MKRVKKYIRVFTILCVLSAILFGLLMSLKVGLLSGMIIGIVGGILWTIIMAIIFIPIDYLLTRDLSTEALNVRQDREIQVKGDFDYVFQKCVDILKGFKTIKIVTPLKEKNAISARTKMSLASFGEDIKLQFDVLAQDVKKIHLSSSPTYRFTLLDYGKNFKNVDMICKMIANHIERG